MAQGIKERFDSPEEESRLGQEHAAANLRVAMPGIIVSFNPEAQTATVQPAITENIRHGQGEVTPTQLPLLTDVPVHFPRAGGYSITLPVKKGDECLLIFADMCIDGWWQSGGVQDQVETRRHDLSDAFAILAPTSQPMKVENYHAENLQIRTDDGNVVVEIDKKEQAVNVVKAKKSTVNLSESATIDAGENITMHADKDILITASDYIKLTAQIVYIGENLEIDGDLTVNGSAYIKKSLEVRENITANGNLQVDGKATVGSDLDISGAASIGGGTSIGGNLTVSGNVSASRDVNIAGTLTVAGINMNTHTHGGVTAGGDNTGSPN